NKTRLKNRLCFYRTVEQKGIKTMNYNEFVSPELSLLIPVLYAIGMFIKNSNIKNWLIPFILGAIGILLTFFYLIS
ncbi:MAG TPA: hypothetical protein DD733_03380, partial [Clostridiales bacterium]|nr:hypothetical protein [Clostridiales bacterium]